MVAPVESMARYKSHQRPLTRTEVSSTRQDVLVGLEMTAPPLLKFRSGALNPSPDRSVVSLQAAFIEYLFDIAERECVPKIPSSRHVSAG